MNYGYYERHHHALIYQSSNHGYFSIPATKWLPILYAREELLPLLLLTSVRNSSKNPTRWPWLMWYRSETNWILKMMFKERLHVLKGPCTQEHVGWKLFQMLLLLLLFTKILLMYSTSTTKLEYSPPLSFHPWNPHPQKTPLPWIRKLGSMVRNQWVISPTYYIGGITCGPIPVTVANAGL